MNNNLKKAHDYRALLQVDSYQKQNHSSHTSLLHDRISIQCIFISIRSMYRNLALLEEKKGR